jgi:hypothetical protein
LDYNIGESTGLLKRVSHKLWMRQAC